MNDGIENAEEAAHTRAAAVVSGDFGTTVTLMTPEALTIAMQLGISNWDYRWYELRARERGRDDYVFDFT